MKTLVLGGGVLGVTSAYYLAKAGHEVTVVDRADDLGTQATAGNAGLIAPGHSFAWASPAAPRMLLRSLLGEKTAIRVKLRPDPELWLWGIKFLRECTADRARRNTLVKLRLCQYSQAAQDELVSGEGIEYHAITRGVLYVYRDQEELETGAAKMKLLQDNGQKQEILDADKVVKIEPALAPNKDKIAGAVYGLSDASGDSQLFTRNLAEVCERTYGTTFVLGTDVKSLVTSGDRVVAAVTDGGILSADNYVLSLGMRSPRLAKTVGVKLPMYPAKGYSVTFPVLDPDQTPEVGGVDEATLVAWSRLGDQFRMSSTAEFSGYDPRWRADDFSNILGFALDFFPGAADYSRGSFRSCFRPMTPDGPPIIGRGHHRNLYYNTGHGHMGWTMACGSSRLLADLMMGREPDLDMEGMLPR